MEKQRSTHRYQLLKEHLMTKIRSGEYVNGAKIDSEPVLCKRFQLSRNTARQALQELENEGFLYRIQGKGTLVRDSDPFKSRKIALLIYDTAYMTHPVTEIIFGAGEVAAPNHAVVDRHLVVLKQLARAQGHRLVGAGNGTHTLGENADTVA